MILRRQHSSGCLTAIAVGLALALSPAPALAQSAADVAPAGRREQAKRQFARGVEHYRGARYAEAVSAFLAADQLAPSPALSFNIARAYERLHDTPGALRWYRDYLRRSPNAPNAAEVQTRIAALAARLAQDGLQQLTIFSTPSGASVAVDGHTLGMTPLTAELPPGPHRLALVLPGYRAAQRDVLVSPTLPGEFSFELAAASRATGAPPGPARTTEPAPIDRDPARRFGIVPWLVAGSGVIGLGGAVGFELARRADERRARSALTQLEFHEKLEDVERDQTRARVLAGVGGGLFITGSVMLLFNDRKKSSTRVGLGCTPRGCSASAKGSF